MGFDFPQIDISDIRYFIRNNTKKLIIIAVAAVVVICGGTFGLNYYKSYKAAQAAANIDWSLHGVTEAELVGGSYYIKDGDIFYPIAPGIMFSTNEKDTPIPKAASPTERMMMFGKDDEQIPTLYRDCELIYKAADYDNAEGEVSPFPGSFYLERYKDDGYTIGIRGLANDGGKFHTLISGTTFYPGCDAQAKIPVKDGQDLVVDKVNGMPVTEQNVGNAGTILGLNNGSTYKVDAYVATSFKGGDIIADTHMFSSYELYELKDYDLSQNGYASVPMPDYMWSGYYNINGCGMFRFVNGFKDQGYDGTLDFNTPYIVGTDEQGNLLTSPAIPATRPGTVSANTTDAATETLMDESSDSEFQWNYDFAIDNQQKEMSIQIEFSDATAIVNGEVKSAADGIKIPGAGTPAAILVSPSGRQYRMTSAGAEEINGQGGVVAGEDEKDKGGQSILDDEEETEEVEAQLAQVLKATIENPETGTWHIKMAGLYARTFNVSTTYTGASTNMVVKDGNSPSRMTIYLPEDVPNAELTFVWEESNHAGTFNISDGDSVEFSNERDKTGSYVYPEIMTDETYGKVIMNPGFMHAGEYEVDITGESLGHVYFSYKNIEKSADTEEESVSSNEVSENEAPESEEKTEAVEEVTDEAGKEKEHEEK